MRTASILAISAVLASTVTAHAQNPQDELAAQVRIQGFACDKAQGATRDKKRSKPDYALAFNGRCLARAILGEGREALADCEQALRVLGA